MRMAETPDPADFYSGDAHAQDACDDDWGYPDAWDLPDEGADDELCQLPDDEREMVRKSPEAALAAGMTTAADLLSRQKDSPLAAGFFRNGMAVSHPTYGDGRIVDLSGKGLKRTAKVVFENGHTQAFRLAFAPLTPTETL